MLVAGDVVHLEVDLRGLHLPFGTMALAINGEASEVIFDDIALSTGRGTRMQEVMLISNIRYIYYICLMYL